LIEAMTGERMPRRPVFQGSAGFWARIGDMLKDRRTWTTIAYFILMLPLGIAYFVTAVVGLSVSIAFIAAPFIELASRVGWANIMVDGGALHVTPEWLGSIGALPVLLLVGVLLLTSLMHLARGVGHLHAMFAKTLLVARAAPDGTAAAVQAAAPLGAH